MVLLGSGPDGFGVVVLVLMGTRISFREWKRKATGVVA